MASNLDTQAAGRLRMALIGGIAGLSAWALDDILTDVIADRYLAVVALFVMGGFGALLALIGSVRLVHASIAGFSLSVLAALGLWSWLERFPDLTRTDPGLAVVAIATLFVVGLPFLGAGLQAPGGWRDYVRLFALAWGIVVRYAAALLFVGLFWLVVFLSDALLQLAGIDMLERLYDRALPRAVLTGLVFGLALAVVHELSDALSPDLLLRLMRLLLPILVAVSGVFLLALPLRGLSEAFGTLSAAATLMAVTIAGLTLVTATVDASDSEAVLRGLPAGAARAMALLSPILAGVALYAVWLRVGQYGWTPERLAALCAAGLLTLYGLAYAGAVLVGRGWARRIRDTNIVMALAPLALSLLWLSPMLNAQRIAAGSQVARFADGRLPLADLPLSEMAHRWGHAGLAALEDLEAMEERPDHAVLVARIAAARDAGRGPVPAGTEDVRTARLTSVAGALIVRPTGRDLPARFLDGISAYHLEQWVRGCSLPFEGLESGCSVIFHQMTPGAGADQAIYLVHLGGGQVEIGTAVPGPSGLKVRAGLRDARSGVRLRVLPADEAATLIRDGARFQPVRSDALMFDDMQLVPDN